VEGIARAWMLYVGGGQFVRSGERSIVDREGGGEVREWVMGPEGD
jgi:hypothetical protein